MLGYRHYSDELVDYFVKKSIDNGIDILRIFDALNDVRNLQTAINAAKKYGGHVQAAISYTTGPVFDTEYYCHYAKELEDAGADSICIKDMANLLLPYTAYELVSEIKKKVGIPVHIHTHIRKCFRKVYEILRRMNGAYGITHRAFANALVFFGAVDCLTQVFDVVQRVENTNDIDAVFD